MATGPLHQSLFLDDTMERAELLAKICVAQQKSSINSLNLRHTLIDRTVALALVGLLKSKRLWRQVVICNVRGALDHVLGAIVQLDNVDTLRLTGYYSGGDSHSDLSRTLAHGLKNNRVLRSLSIFSAILEKPASEVIAAGLQESTCLQEFNLSGCTLDQEAVEALAFALSKNRSVRVLRMDACHLDKQRFQTLLQSLQQPHSCHQLEEISLAQAAQPRLLAKCLDLLQGMPSLKVLRISSSAIQKKGDFAISPLAKYLASPSCRLEHLELSRLGLVDDDIIELVSSLKQSEINSGGLSQLTLSRNYISDIGALELATLIHRTSSLELLNVAGNFIGVQGAQSFLQAIKRSYILQSATLTAYNNRMDRLQMRTAAYGRLNQYGRRLLLHNMSHGGWAHVLATGSKNYRNSSVVNKAAEEANFLFTMLQGQVLLHR